MNKYQVVMPNGDIANVAADKMENVDGDLKFYVANVQVGEFRYWQAWNLVPAPETVDPAAVIRALEAAVQVPPPSQWKADQ